jgi:flagellar motor switch protein FliM
MPSGSTEKQRAPARTSSGGDDARAQAPVPLDFSRPSRFQPELRHRLAAAFTPCCEALGARLETELKSEVSLSLGELAEHTWASARAQLPADSLAVAVLQDAESPPLLMSLELPFLLAAFECLLGGRAGEASPRKTLGEIDWRLARDLVDLLLSELSPAWVELGGPPLRRGELDLEGDAGLANPAGEPTLLVSLQVRLDTVSCALSLLLPWGAAHELAERLGAGPPSRPQSERETAARLRRGLAGAQVLMRAEVGSAQMPAEQMLALEPGSLLALEERSEDGVLLFAEGVSIGRGRPGRSGARRALKLQSTGEPPVRAATYATLGRAELERARVEQRGTGAGAGPGGARASGGGILHSLFVRVWAELGRTHLPLGHTLELRAGTVVELDQDAQAPLELFANGLCFARGSLVVTGEGHWGIELEEIL